MSIDDKPISKAVALHAFSRMDAYLHKDLTLYMGGGTSMVLAYGYPLATSDVDALPKQTSFEEIEE